jgi:biopolymer transport protein TolR
MGMATGAGRKSGRGRRGVPRYGAMADINMTPFIDVMLVLLIIFMVAAPLLTSGVAVDLPQASAGALNVEQKPISVTLNDQGQVFLMDQPTADADVLDKLRELAKDGPDARVYVRASKVVPYGRVAQIMGELTTAGYKKVALVTDPTTSTP